MRPFSCAPLLIPLRHHHDVWFHYGQERQSGTRDVGGGWWLVNADVAIRLCRSPFGGKQSINDGNELAKLPRGTR